MKAKKWILRTCIPTVVLLVLIYAASQIKYVDISREFRRNISLYEETQKHIAAAVSTIADAEKMYGDEIEAELYPLAAIEYPGVRYNEDGSEEHGFYYEYEPRASPYDISTSLYEVMLQLREAGTTSVVCLDFSQEIGYIDPSSCEIWYWNSDCGKYIVYSGNGKLTTDFNPAETDGYGYGVHIKRMNSNWFVVDTYYNAGSDYWNG